MPRVIYKGGEAFVDVSKSDRNVARKVGVKFPRVKRITVDRYATILEKIAKKRRSK